MLSLVDARAIVDAALSDARERRLPPMTIAVLDASGSLVAFAREDGSSLLRERIARAKALGAVATVAKPIDVDALLDIVRRYCA